MSSHLPAPRGLYPNNITAEQSATTHHRKPQSRPRPDLDRPLPPPPPSPPSLLPSLPSTTSQQNSQIRRKPLPQSPNPSQLGHSRSLSHPFSSSLFGGKRADRNPQNVSLPNDVDDSSDGLGVMLGKSKRSKGTTQPVQQVTTGKCSCCDSTVKWPVDIKVFRCATCLTINDLEPCDPQPGYNTYSPDVTESTTPSLSLVQTRRLVDRCIADVFRNLIEDDLVTNGQAPHNEIPLFSDEEPTGGTTDRSQAGYSLLSPPRPAIQHRSPSESALPARVASTRALLPSLPQYSNSIRLHNPSAPVDEDPFLPTSSTRGTEYAFRPLESYISNCFVGCDVLNMSFFTMKPQPPPPSSASTREERLDRGIHSQQRSSDSNATPSHEPDAYLSELDAKVLLLGDFIENGTWWTGDESSRGEHLNSHDRDKSPERGRNIVSAKTPHINWLELAEWYRIILHAGDDWHTKWVNFKTTLPAAKLNKWQEVQLDRLHHYMTESQIHLQRSLLKATENLLRRPRRPLKRSEDCRFLLMLLANPLLSPTLGRHLPRRSSNNQSAARSTRPINGSPSKRSQPPQRHNSTSNLGRHSGIVKRILGLMAYLPNDVHLHLISWFTRFSDAHFASLVDVVGSFVTYRLTRQLNRPMQTLVDPTEGLIPNFAEGGIHHASQVHAALDGRSNSQSKQSQDGKPKFVLYTEDWQIRAAARVMALLFQANTGHNHRKRDMTITPDQRLRSAGLNAKHRAHMHGQMISISNFYNTLLDHADLVADFEAWEVTKTKFTFCQYPFFLSIWAKIHILEHDARRQMETKAREAFFDSILSRKAVSQYLVLKVRRDCLVDDSLKSVSEAVGRGGSDIKKGLRIDFVGEEGVDAGGLRKEWFLLLVREIFNPNHGLFVYDEDSQYCYFNPFCFESSEQFFLVGVLLGLAIYNSTILDVAFPPFVFKKMLASAPPTLDKLTSTPKVSHNYTLEDLAELRPSLARGLRQLLEFDGNVQEVFCRDFMVEMDRYGGTVQVPLCPGGSRRPVTNSNRQEFVDMYVYYLLDQSVARQYEPFKRGFFTVCGGNALSLFRPEEIELLIRGSDEPLDVGSLRAVATYDGWPKVVPAENQPQVIWFWDFFQRIQPSDQRKLLSFITGSDRIPAMGATNLGIRLQLMSDKDAEASGHEPQRFPIARTCFNLLGLYRYRKRETLEQKLWIAVTYSEGFGLK